MNSISYHYLRTKTETFYSYLSPALGAKGRQNAPHGKKKKTLLVDVHHYIQYKQSQFGSKRCTRHHLQRKLTVRGESQSMRVRWQWLGKGLLQAFSAGSRDLRPLLWDRGWSGLWAAQSQLFRSNRSDQEKKRWGGALSSIWPIRKLQLDQ